MDFRILGALEVAERGQVLPVGGAKRRTLLATLVLSRNVPVSSVRLADELWGERPPDRFQNAIHVHIRRLRDVLGDARIETSDHSYRLVTDPGEVDLDRFEQLVEHARDAAPELAARILADALALWRGETLEDVVFEGNCRTEVARLDELRLAVLARRIDSDLAGGRHAALVPELEALVTAHPLREDIRAQLMLALYRCDRQADALATYRSGRRLLHDELGLDPSDALKQLERAILTHDTTLRLASDSPPPARRLRSPFVPARGLAYAPETVGHAGFALLASGESTLDSLSDLASEAIASGNPVAVAHGRLWQAHVAYLKGEDGASKTWGVAIGRALPIFTREGSELGLAHCAFGDAMVGAFRCRATETAGAAERVAAHGRRAGVPYLVTEGVVIGFDHAVMGSDAVDAGLRRCREALERTRGDRLSEASLTFSLSHLYAMRADADEARRLVQHGTRLWRQAGISAFEPPAWKIAFNEVCSGDAPAAQTVLEVGFEKLEREGIRGTAGTLAALVADVCYWQGRFDEAARWCELARERTASDDVFNLSCVDAVEGSLLAQQGVVDEAERRARRAVLVAAAGDFHHVQRIALEHLAHTLTVLGRRAEAAEAADRALGHLRAKGDIASMRIAQERLRPPRRLSSVATA